MAPELRRVHPSPTATISVRAAYDVDRPPHPDRPWVGLCMVSSIEGSTAVDGVSAGLSSPTDTAVLWRLRHLADVIVVHRGAVAAVDARGATRGTSLCRHGRR